MTLRPLLIDDDARAEAERLLLSAGSARYSGEGPTPGDDPRHVAYFGDYRTVFTFTERGDRLFRHLSVSVPGDKFPHVAAVFSIAELFGFTGWDGSTTDRMPSDWTGGMDPSGRAVAVIQEIRT